MPTDPKRIIEISKEGERLLAKLPGQQTFKIVFESETKCRLTDIKDITGAFIGENGKVTKIIVEQNGMFELKKIK